MYNFDRYNVLLAIAAHIPVAISMTVFVLQGHIYMNTCLSKDLILQQNPEQQSLRHKRVGNVTELMHKTR